jgi:glycosyltransferase involved in cell wall biosynthesis
VNERGLEYDGKRLHPPLDKIRVVCYAPESIFEEPAVPQLVEEVRQKHELPAIYLLFVGVLAKKKNLPTLIRALHILRERGLDFPPLIRAGRRYRQSADSAIFAQFHALSLESHMRYIGPVGVDELRGLFSGAEILVFLFLREGSGIPRLEAMKCGVPIIAARSGAIPEAVGDAALLLDNPMNAQILGHSEEGILSHQVHNLPGEIGWRYEIEHPPVDNRSSNCTVKVVRLFAAVAGLRLEN